MEKILDEIKHGVKELIESAQNTNIYMSNEEKMNQLHNKIAEYIAGYLTKYPGLSDYINEKSGRTKKKAKIKIKSRDGQITGVSVNKLYIYGDGYYIKVF